MKEFLHSARFMASDMASTIIFIVVFMATDNLILAASVGVVFGLGQFGWALWRKTKIDTMQWMSLFLVLASAAATVLTHDPRFILIKPAIIYAIIGVVMLKPGWMNRYLPPIAVQMVPDVATVFGFVWSGLMFFSAGLSLYVAYNYDMVTWVAFKLI